MAAFSNVLELELIQSTPSYDADGIILLRLYTIANVLVRMP